jgi:hypothetical protein
VCNLWFDDLKSHGVPGFEGTCSVHINRRKNDTQRKGHYPALGRSWDPELDVAAQLCRARAGGAVRRSETFIIPIASCLQGTILAPTPARLPRPAAWLTAIRHFG